MAHAARLSWDATAAGTLSLLVAEARRGWRPPAGPVTTTSGQRRRAGRPSLSSTTTRPGRERFGRLSALVAAPEDRPRRPSFAPFDGAPIGDVPVCEPADVGAAADRARAAQERWAQAPLADRAAVLLRYHDLVFDRREELLDIVQTETGKARVNAFEELADVAMTARYARGRAAEHLRPRRPRAAIPGSDPDGRAPAPERRGRRHQPVELPPHLVGVRRPSGAGGRQRHRPQARQPDAVHRSRRRRGVVRGGIAGDLVAVVTGSGPTLGPALVDAVDYLMFTGSTPTGRLLAEQCGRRLIGFSAELGGKNPMIVLADCDVRRTVEGAVRACFSNSGQLCISVERMYVEDAVYDRFVPAFVERVGRMRLGAGLDWEWEMGSLISGDQLDVVTRHVDDAVAKGARALTGGRPRPDLGPLFYEPTVLEGVDEGMELMREETFGPVVAVHRVRDADEAVSRANDSRYGLNASIWTAASRGERLAPA